MIFSNINYCQAIWGKCSQNNRNRIQKCINFAAKIVSRGNYKKSDHVTPLLKNLQWMGINNRLILREAVCVYKDIHKSGNTECLQLSTRKQQSFHPNRTLRNDDTLHTEFRRTKTGKNAVSISGPQIWNGIPAEIRNSTNLSCFKKKFVAHLLQEEFDDDINEVESR